MPTRTEIRHSIVDSIKANVPALNVYHEQTITNLDEAMPVAVVYFTDVDTTEDIRGGRTYDGRINTTVMVAGNDDDVDVLVDQVIAGLDADIRDSATTKALAWTQVSITYDHDIKPGTVGCTVIYSVMFRDG